MGSNQLAQQSLIEPPARRRIATSAGASAWWGVDSSSRGVSIAWAITDHDEVRRGVRTAGFSKEMRGGQLLAWIHRDTVKLAAEICALGPDRIPGVIVVEQPSGAHPNPVLSYAVGVIQAALYESVYNATGSPPHLETITSSSWKKTACGSGAIRKPKNKAEGEYKVLTWARLQGYPGGSWDEADALAIAEAARLDIALTPR